MFAPRFASPRAISRPTRLPAPVTSAVFPDNSMTATLQGKRIECTPGCRYSRAMKAKVLAVLCLSVLVLTSIARAETDQPPRNHNALRKLGRGFSNLLFGIVELPNTFTKTNSEHGGAAGVTYGVGKGLVRWVCR